MTEHDRLPSNVIPFPSREGGLQKADDANRMMIVQPYFSVPRSVVQRLHHKGFAPDGGEEEMLAFGTTRYIFEEDESESLRAAIGRSYGENDEPYTLRVNGVEMQRRNDGQPRVFLKAEHNELVSEQARTIGRFLTERAIGVFPMRVPTVRPGQRVGSYLACIDLIQTVSTSERPALRDFSERVREGNVTDMTQDRRGKLAFQGLRSVSATAHLSPK